MGDIKLAVFDVAGTTAKDDGLVVKAFVSAAISQGIACNSEPMHNAIEYVEKTMGQRKIDVFKHIFEGDLAKAEAAHERFITAYLELIQQGELEEFSGISDLFSTLKLRGIGVAITTGFPREILDLIIESLNWSNLVDYSVAASEVSNGRPDPEMILRCIDQYNFSNGASIVAGDIAVIGDTVSDIQSGINAGARFVVGINSGTHTSQALIGAGATHILAATTELLTSVNFLD